MNVCPRLVGQELEWRFGWHFHSQSEDEEVEAPDGAVTHPRSFSLQQLGWEWNHVCLTSLTDTEMLSVCWRERGRDRRETGWHGETFEGQEEVLMLCTSASRL